MTSQLNVDTIVDKAGSGGPSLPNTTTIKISNTSTNVSDGGAVTQNLVQGLVKAWCSGGNDASLSNTFNIASGTDNGTGDYSYTLTNSLSSNEIAGGGASTDNTDQNLVIHSPTTSSYRIEIYQQNGSEIDRSNRTVICGDMT
tara:strand:- start:51 stop:479 length:429 start_codon:yes stop_codon:yes gene_type:complete